MPLRCAGGGRPHTSLDTQATWAVSFAKPFTGNTEEWLNNVTYDGKLANVEVVRTDRNTFDISGYSTMSQTKPDFKVLPPFVAVRSLEADHCVLALHHAAAEAARCDVVQMHVVRERAEERNAVAD